MFVAYIMDNHLGKALRRQILHEDLRYIVLVNRPFIITKP